MKIVVTIPAFNEEKTIGEVITEIKGVMDKTRFEYNLLIIDDGSRDRTKDWRSFRRGKSRR